ncbi:MAG TPA: DNA polymerase III subunit alpha [Fluviicola sp.]|nr:DNA polymerase III subunit alpha [Fluviicola sp.]
MFLIFDTETTGLPRDWNAPLTDFDNWPRAVQIAWQLHDAEGEMLEHKDFLIQPDGYDIPFDAERIHGISTALATQQGALLDEVLVQFKDALSRSQFVVGQNIGFDINIMGCELLRRGVETNLHDLPVLDTCTETTANLTKLPGGRGGRFKLPTLTELHEYLFQVPFGEAHNATADVEATTRCFFELVRREVFTLEELKAETDFFERFKLRNPGPIAPVGLTHINLKEASAKLKDVVAPSAGDIDREAARVRLKDAPFVHLHNHTQFTILQSTMDVKGLIKQAIQHKMPAVALTDTANMMAAFHFEKAIAGINKQIRADRAEAEEKGEPFDQQEIMPIIGCELYVCRDRNDKQTKDNGFLVVFLAKNKRGYHNLVKLASIAYTEGMYYVPRVDKAVVEQYKEDLIVLTGGLSGEVPNLLLNVGEKQAEEALIWWKEQFGSDLYVEIMRHGQEDEDRVNASLVKLAQKHGVSLVATNNTFYATEQDANTHDILLCVRDGVQVATPKGKGRNFRFGLENEQYYFKSAEEMKELFLDLPEAIESVGEILAKIEPYPLAREVLLPAFDIPAEFVDPLDETDGGKRGENAYLRYLTYKGAEKRYPVITDEIRERLDFELATVERTGYPGYFLIVQDFCQAARDMGVSVGPGRGSAAGSAVAYCIGITNVDPIAYDLLFERFLNPDRVSMPDIDIDFDDEGRGRVIDWVINKYGSNQVAQIITYGTMAAKSSIRDAGRVLNLPLLETNMLAKLIPDNFSLDAIFNWEEPKIAEKLNNAVDMANVQELRSIARGSDLRAEVLRQAQRIEGSVRNTGIHACGVIITPDDITNFVPVALAKDSSMWCTQFDNSVAEEAGLLKMDFLGLKTLTLIKDAVKNVKKRHGIDLDPDAFPIDDLPTYELFQRGETVGIFQYESPGMQKYMRELKPSVFADLIAMNALYRPGPLEYIPSFVKRKNGEEEIKYDLDACEEYLAETYGITVYQEQVMLLSQKLAGFSKGDADVLRKAMGKKQKAVLDKMKPQFIEQGKERGHDPTVLEKIWKDWEAFASYAFNKSHSTCYAWVAYQTAYLKANYPAEFMAAVLSNNLNDISQVTFFMEECRRMGVAVLGPDVNESAYEFTVNAAGAIRFGLGGIKGLGSGPVDAIIHERAENGPFSSIFDMTKRVNLRLVNKKAMESMAYAGCFDSFSNIHRAQYFYPDGNGRTFLENAVRFGASLQENENSSQVSMFGESSDIKMPEPQVPVCDEWPTLVKLNFEKEVVGIFISGHPLDDFRLEIEAFCSGKVEMLTKLPEYYGRELLIAAIVTDIQHLTTKTGKPFGIMNIEDYAGGTKLYLFGDNYLKFDRFMKKDLIIAIRGKVQEGPYKDKITGQKPIEFAISNIEQLENLLETRSTTLNITIPIKSLDQLLMGKLENLFMESEGKCSVKFTVVDVLDDMKVTMPSRKLKIEPSVKMINAIKELQLEVELVGS